MQGDLLCETSFSELFPFVSLSVSVVAAVPQNLTQVALRMLFLPPRGRSSHHTSQEVRVLMVTPEQGSSF